MGICNPRDLVIKKDEGVMLGALFTGSVFLICWSYHTYVHVEFGAPIGYVICLTWAGSAGSIVGFIKKRKKKSVDAISRILPLDFIPLLAVPKPSAQIPDSKDTMPITTLSDSRCSKKNRKFLARPSHRGIGAKRVPSLP